MSTRKKKLLDWQRRHSILVFRRAWSEERRCAMNTVTDFTGELGKAKRISLLPKQAGAFTRAQYRRESCRLFNKASKCDRIERSFDEPDLKRQGGNCKCRDQCAADQSFVRTATATYRIVSAIDVIARVLI